MTTEAIVYIVDDDESVRRALSWLMRSVGVEAKTFPSAQAFLAEPPADRPACLVLDFRLPGTSGLDLQAMLPGVNRSLPIVFISGHGDVPISVRAMKNGAVDFLAKPFDDQDLLDAVQRALAKSRNGRAAASERVAIQHRLDRLTRRERQVLDLVTQGLLNKQIAAELGASEKTIKVHRGRMMQKMQAGSVAELVQMAAKVGVPGVERTTNVS